MFKRLDLDDGRWYPPVWRPFQRIRALEQRVTALEAKMAGYDEAWDLLAPHDRFHGG